MVPRVGVKKGIFASIKTKIYKNIIYFSILPYAKRYSVNAQLPIDTMQSIVYNAHMSLNWLKKTKRKKIITINEIASRYGIHRNSVKRLVERFKEDEFADLDLYDLWSVYHFLKYADIIHSRFDVVNIRTKRIIFFDLITELLGEPALKKIYQDYKSSLER